MQGGLRQAGAGWWPSDKRMCRANGIAGAGGAVQQMEACIPPERVKRTTPLSCPALHCRPTCRPLLWLTCSPSAPSAGGAPRPRPRPRPGARGSRGGRAGGVMPFSSLYCGTVGREGEGERLDYSWTSINNPCLATTAAAAAAAAALPAAERECVPLRATPRQPRRAPPASRPGPRGPRAPGCCGRPCPCR